MTTLRHLLFDDGDASGPLHAILSDRRLGLGRKAISGVGVPTEEVASTVARLLDVPIGNIMARGWGRHQEVQRAKSGTAADPGSRQVVHLLEHTVTSRQSPTIEMSVGGTAVPILELDLELAFTVQVADLVIESGRITEVDAGQVLASGRLSASGVVLVERELEPMYLSGPTDAERRAFFSIGDRVPA